jgi:hypothetical protein
MKVARLSVICTGRLYLQGRSLVLITVKRLSGAQGHSAARRIEHATFRLMARCLNQLCDELITRSEESYREIER